MNFDRRRVFGHDFAARLAELLYMTNPSESPELFGMLADCVGMSKEEGRRFAEHHRAPDPKINRGNLILTLRVIANMIEAERKKGKRSA